MVCPLGYLTLVAVGVGHESILTVLDNLAVVQQGYCGVSLARWWAVKNRLS
jgi:hypothetical protein